MIERDTISEYVRSATAEVFSTMLGMELTPMPEFLDQTPPTISNGVMALVGLAGPYTGAGVISCSTEFAIRVSNQLLMAEETFVSEDVLDAMGEVANMIIGNFKNLAEEHVGALCLSIPTVIYGRNFTSRSLGTGAWVVIPFEHDGEVMQVKICLIPSATTTTTRAGATSPVTVNA